MLVNALYLMGVILSFTGWAMFTGAEPRKQWMRPLILVMFVIGIFLLVMGGVALYAHDKSPIESVVYTIICTLISMSVGMGVHKIK